MHEMCGFYSVCPTVWRQASEKTYIDLGSTDKKPIVQEACKKHNG